MENSTKIKKLVEYIEDLKGKGFQIVDHIDGNYDHIGATIIDAILQSGIKYKTVVRPRVNALLKYYGSIKTLSGFIGLIEEKGLNNIINWNGKEKLRRVQELIDLFKQQNIETEEDLRKWLSIGNNDKKLMRLRGIKNKTVDYLKILAGIQAIAPDMHLIRFVNNAGVQTSSYDEVQELLHQAAEILGIREAYLDHSIWEYMSENQGTCKDPVLGCAKNGSKSRKCNFNSSKKG
jgi:endonuclease III